MSILDPVNTLPFGQPLTRADLDDMPDDDGHRYELIDGVLIVTPAPAPSHQNVLGNLYFLLRTRCPDELKIYFAPLDVVISDDTVMQPDLLVAHGDDFTEKDLPTAPMLAVEVLSPSTRRIDLMLKWSRYEAAGCGSYWVVDPIEPSLIAWELRDGTYVEVAKVVGNDEFRAELPFGVTVVPGDLVR